MILKKLRLHNFRNYAKQEFVFSPSVNIIVGDNAQGKTNLLEAIYFLSTGRSFRTNNYKELIRENEKFFHLDAIIEKNSIEERISVYYDEKQRKIWVNNTQSATFSSLLGIIPAVLFSPEDLQLITGFPSLRRRLLNVHLSQYDPLYVFHLIRYSRALKQRNELLKKRALPTLGPWENAMAKSALYLMEKRKEMTSELNEFITPLMNKLSAQGETLHLYYQSLYTDLSHEEPLNAYLQFLEKMRSKELDAGYSLVGPHRDDMMISLNKKPARRFASEGQKQTALTSIRLAEYLRLQKYIENPPLLHIDDLGSHLDAHRNAILHHSLKDFSQVFFTTPEISSFERTFSYGKIFEITSGKLQEEKELQVL